MLAHSSAWTFSFPEFFLSLFSFFFIFTGLIFSYNIYGPYIFLCSNLSQILATSLSIRLHSLPTHSPSKKKQKGIKTIKKTKLLKDNKKHIKNMKSLLCRPSYSRAWDLPCSVFNRFSWLPKGISCNWLLGKRWVFVPTSPSLAGILSGLCLHFFSAS